MRKSFRKTGMTSEIGGLNNSSNLKTKILTLCKYNTKLQTNLLMILKRFQKMSGNVSNEKMQKILRERCFKFCRYPSINRLSILHSFGNFGIFILLHTKIAVFEISKQKTAIFENFKRKIATFKPLVYIVLRSIKS